MNFEKLLTDFLGAQRGGPGSHPSRRGAGTPASSGGSLVDQVGGFLQGSAGRAIGTAVVGGLASRMFRGKGLSKLPGTALKLGGAAVVAGLAYKAYQSYQSREGITALPGAEPVKALRSSTRAEDIPEARGTAFLPAGGEEDRARLILSAMIAAAKADGHIDQEEQDAIFSEIDAQDLDADAKGYVMDEMRRPLSVDELARRATTPEIAMEVYTASVLAIDADQPAEKAYLDLLAARLNLPAELAEEIRTTTGAAQG